MLITCYCDLVINILQGLCAVAAKSIEGLSKRVEKAVCNMLEVFKFSYEKVREGSRPRKRTNKNDEETPEEVFI